MESEMAEPMSASEESLSLRQQAYWFGNLQNQLSREQRSLITETADLDSIIAMSEQASNTQALDILWQASQYRSGNEAIQLLQKSTHLAVEIVDILQKLSSAGRFIPASRKT